MKNLVAPLFVAVNLAVLWWVQSAEARARRLSVLEHASLLLPVPSKWLGSLLDGDGGLIRYRRRLGVVLRRVLRPPGAPRGFSLGCSDRVLISPAVRQLHAYAYDPFGRRIKKTANGTTTSFLWDGDVLAAEFDGSGSRTRRYTYDGRIGKIVRPGPAGRRGMEDAMTP